MAQGDFLVGDDETINGQNVSFGVIAISSYLLNGRYYFKKEGFRPYGSLGLGITSIGSVEAKVNGNNGDVEVAESKSNFAIRPALGFKYGVLNMNVAYLNAGKTGEGDFEQSVSDFTINLGLLFTFGGN